MTAHGSPIILSYLGKKEVGERACSIFDTLDTFWYTTRISPSVTFSVIPVPRFIVPPILLTDSFIFGVWLSFRANPMFYLRSYSRLSLLIWWPYSLSCSATSFDYMVQILFLLVSGAIMVGRSDYIRRATLCSRWTLNFPRWIRNQQANSPSCASLSCRTHGRDPSGIVHGVQSFDSFTTVGVLVLSDPANK